MGSLYLTFLMSNRLARRVDILCLCRPELISAGSGLKRPNSSVNAGCNLARSIRTRAITTEPDGRSVGQYFDYPHSKKYFSGSPGQNGKRQVSKRWNQLGQEAVDATSINAFKSKLDRLRCVMMGFFMD